MNARRFAGGLLLCALAGAAPRAIAAAGACDAPAEPAQRALCADPVAHALDARLNAAWPRALAAAPDAAALRRDQRDWLRMRDRRCLDDRTALRGCYVERLAELEADPRPAAWAGRWQRVAGPGLDATLEFTQAPDGRVEVAIEASNGGNSGTFAARGRPQGARLVLTPDALEDARCRLTLQRVLHRIEIAQDGSDADCGAGAGVGFDGRYVRAGSPPPAWTLATLGVVDADDDDARIRRLLGDVDYAALLRTANQRYVDDAQPAVTRLGVRGLYTAYEAAVIADRTHGVHVMLLGDDDEAIRYYTDTPSADGRWPGALAPWLEGRTRPVRLMAQPGRPLRTLAE